MGGRWIGSKFDADPTEFSGYPNFGVDQLQKNDTHEFDDPMDITREKEVLVMDLPMEPVVNSDYRYRSISESA